MHGNNVKLLDKTGRWDIYTALFLNGSLSICILQNVGFFFSFLPLVFIYLAFSHHFSEINVLFHFSCISLRSKSLSRKALFLKVIRLMLSIGKYFQVIGA